MIVLSLWAMVKTVQSSNWVRMVDWMRSSVSRSIAAVASSRMRILVFLRRARAKHTSCLWPTLYTQQHTTHETQHYREPLVCLETTKFDSSADLLLFFSSEPTWGSLLPLHTPAPVLPAGCWQTCGGENVPELSTPPHHCTSQRGPGSSLVCLRTAQAPVVEKRFVYEDNRQSDKPQMRASLLSFCFGVLVVVIVLLFMCRGKQLHSHFTLDLSG